MRHSKEAAYLVFNLAKNLQALLYVYRNWTEYSLDLCILYIMNAIDQWDRNLPKFLRL
jgi:hypothetical protein